MTRIPQRVVLLGMAVGALALPLPAAAEPVMTTSGTCTQTVVEVLAITDRVRDWVPAGFPIIEAAGRSPMFFTGIRCDPHTVDGISEPTTYGLASVHSTDPDGGFGPELHGYDLWWMSSTPAAAAGYTRLGVTNELVAQMPINAGPSGGYFDALKASRFPFKVQTKTLPLPVPPGGVPVDFNTFHWHIGDQGRVLMDPLHSAFTAYGGVGTVTAPAGSPVAELMGTTRATGVAALFRFSFTGAYGLG